MLVNAFGKKISASLMTKNSQFYIEVAKFVQAYSLVLSNPNVFLGEIGEPSIDENNDKLSWNVLSKILQTCDFGFAKKPSNSDLLVYYNYAIEMGSIEQENKKLATVDEIADAQKNYYNFVDEAKDKAEAEFLKQHRITKLRENEVNEIKSKLKSYTFQKWIAFSLTIVAVILFCVGAIGLFFNNFIVETIGSIFPVNQKQYLGSIILIVVAVAMFYFCEIWHQSSKQEFLKLDHASQTIFLRNNSNFIAEQILKNKLDALKRDLQIIQNEINDKNKTYDVKANIERLLESNAYYKKYYQDFMTAYSAEAKMQHSGRQGAGSREVAIEEPVFEQIQEQEIMLEGRFDEQAYNEKFEKVDDEPKSQNENDLKTQLENKSEDNQETYEQNFDKNQQMADIQRLEQQMVENQQEEIEQEISDEQLQSYLQFIKSVLGDESEGYEREK